MHRLRRLGFDGPFPGTRHHFMVYKEYRLTIPSNPTPKPFGAQLRMMLRREVESILRYKIPLDKWNKLS